MARFLGPRDLAQLFDSGAVTPADCVDAVEASFREHGSGDVGVLLPDVPTMTEAGVPGFEAVGLAGILAPAGTPPAIVDKLSREIAAILRTPDVRAQLEAMGLEVVASTPAQFASYIEADSKKWGKIIKDAGIKVE